MPETAAPVKEVRGRRPKARHRDVIIGCMEERLSMLDVGTDGAKDSLVRLIELLDELKRSMNGKGDDSGD